jgi:Reverse transcriptase (RNA-dependent DNA polymerase)
MSLEYQNDVKDKLKVLREQSQVIHRDMCGQFTTDYTISTIFREKSLERITEKDITDYGGVESFKTQVKNIFAARLCPSYPDKTVSDKQVKDKMQNTINAFYKGKKNIMVSFENKTLKNGMNVRYVVFDGHIELQILTLCLLFQKSLDLGVVPQSWKLANITPLHKNGSKLSPTNYRGISLTSVLCKLLERIVAAHIYNHLICNNILSKNQHGFVPRRSTTTNLLETMDIITGSLNEGLGVDVIYLDFIKAFDRVAHARLVLKLRGIGLAGMLLSWCVSFLVNRKQRVVMGENMGDWMSIDSGVPQGSVLGPLFFIIYINDLISSIDIPIKVYADDTKLIIAYKDSDECVHGQNVLYIISEWTKLWLLYLNIDKCKVLHLGGTKFQNNKTTYYLNGIPLQTTEFEKDLGIIVNQKLNWTQHITKICINATYWRKILHKCFKFKSLDVIKKLYTSIIRPKIEYAASIWNPTSAKCMDMLEKVQRSSLKVGPLRKLNYPARLAKLELTTLKIRRLRGDLIQLFRYYNCFDNLSMPNSPKFSQSSTRGHRFKFIQERCLHASRQQFIFNRLASIWNRLPDAIINVKSVNEFKNAI